MPLQSAFANLYEAVTARLDTLVPELRYINHDLGQLEEPRPSVSWPCALLDFDEFEFTDVGGTLRQLGDGFVVIRLGLQQWSGTSNLKATGIREKGLQYYELERKVFDALHGWAPTGFGRFLRRKASTEKRDDDIRVRLLVFTLNFEEQPGSTLTTIDTPAPTIRAERS